MHPLQSRPDATIVGVIGLCSAVLVGSGCATIVNGRTQAVTVTSEPPGAHLFIKSQLVGVTPARLKLKRGDEHLVLRFEKDGFSPQEIALKRSASAWLIGDVALGGDPLSCQGLNSVSACPSLLATNVGVFVLIDAITGAAFALPKVVRAVLAPIGY